MMLISISFFIRAVVIPAKYLLLVMNIFYSIKSIFGRSNLPCLVFGKNWARYIAKKVKEVEADEYLSFSN